MRKSTRVMSGRKKNAIRYAMILPIIAASGHPAGHFRCGAASAG